MGSWIFPFSPGGKCSLGNRCGHMRSPSCGLREPRLKTSLSTSLPITAPQRRAPGRTRASVLRTQLSAAWQQRGKGNYRQAGLETLLRPHLNFMCPRASFQPPGIEVVSRHRSNVCLSCFCLQLNTSTSWKPEGVGHCKQF